MKEHFFPPSLFPSLDFMTRPLSLQVGFCCKCCSGTGRPGEGASPPRLNAKTPLPGSPGIPTAQVSARTKTLPASEQRCGCQVSGTAHPGFSGSRSEARETSAALVGGSQAKLRTPSQRSLSSGTLCSARHSGFGLKPQGSPCSLGHMGVPEAWGLSV